jgi:hypothetical protein
MEERKDSIALTQVCSWKPREGTRASVSRSLMRSATNEEVGSLPEVAVTFDAGMFPVLVSVTLRPARKPAAP